ncbi:MAG: transglycosylase domain-containing protein [Thermostichus sp. DG_1_6_bins_120]
MSAAKDKKSLLGTITRFFKTLSVWRSSPAGATALLKPAEPAASKRPVRLRITCPGEVPQVFVLKGGEILGRSRTVATIRIPAASVSHLHARIRPRLDWCIPKLGWRIPLPALLYWLGWNAGRYQLEDQDSTNGVFRRKWFGGSERVQRVILRHGQQLSFGPPEDPGSVFIQVLDPPPPQVHGVRGCLALVVALTVGLRIWIGHEWSKFSVEPPLAVERSPLVVLAGDQQTELRRTQADSYRVLNRLEDFGPILPKVVVAAEDHRFYSHFGVDVLGIVRAFWVNLRSGEVQQGGSSISQQLARTVLRDYTGSGNTFGRKLREAVAALKLERHYSKKQILTLYLNNVYLGNGIYGFETAAQFYFGIPSQQLSLAEAATLAGILPAPNAFNPVTNYDAAVRARDRVLDRLSELRVFSEEEIRRARRSRLTLNPNLRSQISTVAPYFYSTVFEEMRQLLGEDLSAEGNFILETTLHLPYQQVAEQVLAQTVREAGSTFGFRQGSLVSLDSRNGEVLALVGGSDYGSSQFNRATQARRQPGSTFKVFTYAAALSQGISPNLVLSCEPLTWGNLTFNGCRSGSAPMDLARGFILSENVIALRLAQQVGLERVVSMARQMGIQAPLQPYPSMVIGTMEVNLLELTAAFAPFANQGIWSKPHTIRRILDSSDCADRSDFRTCREIYPGREDPRAQRRVLPASVAQQMTGLLQGVISSGTGRAARLGIGEAGKTGTTTANRDLLFVGYTPNPPLVTGIWLGNDDASPSRGHSGLAAQAWGNYMRQLIR